MKIYVIILKLLFIIFDYLSLYLILSPLIQFFFKYQIVFLL